MKKNLHLKLSSVLLLGLSLYGVGYGQGRAVRSMEQALLEGNLVKNGIHFTEVPTLVNLQDQVQRSYQRALQMQRKYPGVWPQSGPSEQFVAENIAANIGSLNRLSPADIYPTIPALSSAQIPDYFLTRHNLRLRQWLPILNKRQFFLYGHEDVLQKHWASVKHPAREDVRWLANRVTNQTNYFLIGEYHGYTEITNTVTELVLALRLAHPERKIFLFTEFFPENQIWHQTTENNLFIKKQRIWDAADIMNIPVIGLEPTYVTDFPDVRLKCRDEAGHVTDQSAWISLEGIRLRNERWMKVIRAYRQKYPDALFVIYSGGGHLNYTEPYSLGRQLAGKHTLVAMIYPQTRINHKGRISTLVDDFDFFTEGKFPQRILWFNNPASAWRAGFDVRLKISVSHESR